jgi:hypothetical protein
LVTLLRNIPGEQPETAAIALRLTVSPADLAPLAAAIAFLLPSATTPEGWPEWMSVETVARYIDCTPERIRKLVARREIPFSQEAHGCRLSFGRHSIDSWCAQRSSRPVVTLMWRPRS